MPIGTLTIPHELIGMGSGLLLEPVSIVVVDRLAVQGLPTLAGTPWVSTGTLELPQPVSMVRRPPADSSPTGDSPPEDGPSRPQLMLARAASPRSENRGMSPPWRLRRSTAQPQRPRHY